MHLLTVNVVTQPLPLRIWYDISNVPRLVYEGDLPSPGIISLVFTFCFALDERARLRKD